MSRPRLMSALHRLNRRTERSSETDHHISNGTEWSCRRKCSDRPAGCNYSQQNDHPSRDPHNSLCDVQSTQCRTQSNTVIKPTRDGCSAGSCSGLKPGTRDQDVRAASRAAGRFSGTEPNIKELRNGRFNENSNCYRCFARDWSGTRRSVLETRLQRCRKLAKH